MGNFHKPSKALRTNHFRVCVDPKRIELKEFSNHIQYCDVTEHAGAGADVVVGVIHPIDFPELPRAIKEGKIQYLQLEVYDLNDEVLIYTMQFEECSLKKVHRRFDYHINEAVIVEYHFHAKQVDVIIDVKGEKDDVDRSNWSDTEIKQDENRKKQRDILERKRKRQGFHK